MRQIRSSSRSPRRWLLPALLSCLACTTQEVPDDPGESLAQSRGEVVYGTDNRQDVYAHPDATLRARAQQSTVALIPMGFLDMTNPNNVVVRTQTLKEKENLCDTERFLDDPTGGFCSGTLIDDDLVLTAGHCVATSQDCAGLRFVFNYYRPSADTLQVITAADVFHCVSIVSRSQRQTSDYGVVRLDRPATPRFTPAPVRTSGSPLSPGQNVAVIGSGSGIPLKLDSGGSVRDPHADALDFFVASTDTFAGNSGSGVYETGGYTVAGILVRGETDYVKNGSCNVVNVCPEAGCRGEESTYAFRAIGSFCRDTGNASTRLCGNKTADFNNDANLDVLWQNDTGNKSAVWFMDKGAFVSETQLQGPADTNWRPVVAGDFDGDGNLDVLRHHRTQGQLAFWFMREGTLRSEAVLQGFKDVNWRPVLAADLDSDGHPDILWHHRTQGRIALWFMRNGTRLSEAVLQGPKDVNWRPVAAGDFDRDGNLDILWNHRTLGQLSLWFMRGGSRLSSVVLPGLPDVNWRPVSVGDLDKDGNLDVLWHHRTLGQVSLWFMQGATRLSSVVLPGPPDVNWELIRTGDYNGDGSLDFLWHHRTKGRLALWFMRGSNRLGSTELQGLPDVNWYVVP